MNRLMVPALQLALRRSSNCIKCSTTVCLSSSSKDEDKSSPRQSSEAVQDKMPKWTPRRRRASLSPTDRLFTALSEEAGGPLHHVSRESRNSRAQSGDLDSNTCRPSPTDTASKVAPTEPTSSGTDGEELDKLCHGMHRRQRHLSPLKRFSGMIPEKYWKENNVCTSVKQDLDELIKSDDPSKK